VFKIASVSKQFIATGIMLLVQDGKISVDAKVSRLLPDAPPTWSDITLRHLLTHTSGLVREAPGFDPFKIQPDIDVIKTAYPLPLNFKPGDRYQYSNLGYFVLAEIIRRASGKPWEEFIPERVFKPLGMSSTRVVTTTEIVANRADGYAWVAEKQQYENSDDWTASRPSGAFLSTVLDMAKWEAALLTDTILTASSKAEMWKWVTLNDQTTFPYGFGWQLNDWPADSPTRTGVPMIRHGGSDPGFRAGFLRWPTYGLAVIILTNRREANIDGLGANIAIRAVPELRTTPAGK
jgi:CubicO group peptidase (beta-lactamase class C family)